MEVIAPGQPVTRRSFRLPELDIHWGPFDRLLQRMLRHLPAGYDTEPLTVSALRQAMHIYVIDLLAEAQAHGRLQVSVAASRFQAITNLT